MSNLSLKEKLFFLFLILVAGASGYLLFQDNSALLEGGKGERVASLVSYENTVKYRGESALGWASARSGVDLYNGEQVFTHDKSMAKIRYKDGSIINVEENTLLKISEGSNGLDIDLSKGFLVLTMKGRKTMNLLVNGKRKALNLNNAKVEIKSLGGGLSLGVLSGSVGLGSDKVKAGSELNLENKKIKPIVTKEIKEIKPLEVIAPLRMSHYTISEIEEMISINLQWKRVKGLRYEIDFISANGKKSQKRTAQNKVLVKDLLVGDYSWRVRGLQSGRKGPWSDVIPFSIVKESEFELLSPKLSEKLNATGDHTPISFEWSGGRSKATYSLKVTRDNVSEKIRITDGQHLYRPELEEDFSWEIIENGSEAIVTKGNVKYHALKILPLDKSTLTIFHPKQKIRMNWSQVQKDEVEGSDNKSKKKMFIFEFSDKEDFSEIKLKINTNASSFRLDFSKILPKLLFGKVFWRAHLLDKVTDNYILQKKVYTFSLKQSGLLKAPTVPNEKRLVSSSDTSEEYEITWSNIKRAKNYVIEIFEDQLLEKNVLKGSVTTNEYLWIEDVVNSYYYRVTPVDHWGREGTPSKVGVLISPIAPFYYKE